MAEYVNHYEAVENGVNVRTSPHLNSTIVGQLNQGQRITGGEVVEGDQYEPLCGATAPSNQWLAVRYWDDTVRYVTEPCLKLVD
jgi:hypothetical protein